MPVMRRNTYITESNKVDSKVLSGSRRVTKKMDLLDRKLDSMYRDIYISRPDNKRNYSDITNRLDIALDQLQSIGDTSTSSMTELLRRIEKTPNTNNYIKSVEELFGDQNLITTLFANTDIHRYIRGQNYQYDLICKYLPRLQDALEIKRDNVLSADSFNNEFLHPKSISNNKRAAQLFDINTKKLEEVYKVSEFFEKLYMDVSKYGEAFVYIVPYSEAFQRIIRRSNLRKTNSRTGSLSYYESVEEDYGIQREKVQILKEGYVNTKEFREFSNVFLENKNLDGFNPSFEGFDINLKFNDNGIINSYVAESQIAMDKSQMYKSLSSIFESKSLKQQYEDIKLNNDGITQATKDGLILAGDVYRDPDKIDKDISGAVFQKLPRENVIPVYLDKKCIGYYYLEFAEDHSACGFCGGHHTTPGISNAQNFAYHMSEDQQELAIRYVASRIAASIDTHFINSNKDLKEDIYAVLQYNEKFDISRTNDIGVTFIPADDIVHCYFELDEDTHRGISDLQRSLVPAMLYILLYLTDIIGKISRSSDKRVYYVKQNVEQNVAKTMMNVVQQIKKGNMGMRQIESMNNMLNIVGKYNDFIIPLGPSGDPPISFEVMQGQQVETPTDIMEKMEEAAINAILPIEMVNGTYSQDFAIKYAMSNIRVLKEVYTRQRRCKRFYSTMYTKLYNYEFMEQFTKIEIILPPPTYLTGSNNQQLIENITSLADKIIDTEYSNESDEFKAEFKRRYVRQALAAYLDYDEIARIADASKVSIAVQKDPDTEDGEGSDMYDM